MGPSSGDLRMFISKTTKSVIVCHKLPLGFSLGLELPNVTETRSVEAVRTDWVITADNEYIKCDTIVFCTGYIINYPFLDEECGLVVKKHRKYASHLYEMMIFTQKPTVDILNMIYGTPEISIVDVQVKIYFKMNGFNVLNLAK